jgi:hypothetical protein
MKLGCRGSEEAVLAGVFHPVVLIVVLFGLLLFLVLSEQAVDFGDLFVFELEGQSRLDLPIEIVLAPEHGGLVYEEDDGQSAYHAAYPTIQGW